LSRHDAHQHRIRLGRLWINCPPAKAVLVVFDRFGAHGANRVPNLRPGSCEGSWYEMEGADSSAALTDGSRAGNSVESALDQADQLHM